MSVAKIVACRSGIRRILSQISLTRTMSNDSQQPGWGSGKGSGGGAGGTIREAGGALGKREAAQEEEYFRRLSAQQLETLKSSLSDEIKYHKEEIEDHQKALQRHKEKLEELEKLSK